MKLHRKKAFQYYRRVPSQDVTYQTLPERELWRHIKLFLPRETLVSDIPAGDGNIEKLFLQCRPCIVHAGILYNSKYIKYIIQGEGEGRRGRSWTSCIAECCHISCLKYIHWTVRIAEKRLRVDCEGASAWWSFAARYRWSVYCIQYWSCC
jgi:hypothetical protein